MKVKKQPNWFGHHGAFWFDEMVYKTGYSLEHYFPLEVQGGKLCYMCPDLGKYIFFDERTQSVFKQWLTNSVEAILIGES